LSNSPTGKTRSAISARGSQTNPSNIVTPKLTDNFDIILTWDHNDGGRLRSVDLSVLTFSPCSISEFEVRADIQFAASMNYQGPARVQFLTCVYAFELEGLAKNLRALAQGERVEELMVGATDISMHVHRASDSAQPVAELRYEHYRCDPFPVGSTSEFKLLLGPILDPIGTAKIIEEVLRTLEMDCDPFPEHGPLKQRPS
jgi:hypothetical protein